MFRISIINKTYTMRITKKYLKNLIYRVNGAVIEVHRVMEPGLLESVYHKCLERELIERNIKFVSEMVIPIEYKGIDLESEMRCDLFVENVLPVEIKAVDDFHPIHNAQLLTYMNLLQAPEGLLINFNVLNIFKEGQRTLVNEIYRELENE